MSHGRLKCGHQGFHCLETLSGPRAVADPECGRPAVSFYVERASGRLACLCGDHDRGRHTAGRLPAHRWRRVSEREALALDAAQAVHAS